MSTPADLNLGPLTTAFTAPSDCNSITVSADSSSNYAPYVYPRLFSSIANSCFPSGYPLGNAALTSTFAPYTYQDQHVYFSPGICPSGWLQNTVSVSNAETTAFCCQPGFNPQTTPAVQGGASSTFCVSTLDTTTVITTVAYTGDGEADGFTRTFTFSDNTMPAGAIWIRYKDSDFPSTSTTSTSSTSTSSSKQTPSSTNSSSPTSGATSGSSSGLSNGAKIGLGVGIPLAVILAAVIFSFIFIRRRKQKTTFDTAGTEGGISGSEFNHQAEWTGAAGVRPKSELPAGELRLSPAAQSESTFAARSELDGGSSTGQFVSELDAGPPPGAYGGRNHDSSGTMVVPDEYMQRWSQ